MKINIQKRTYKNYIIPILITILIGLVSISAGLYFSNSNTNYLSGLILMSIILCPITKKKYERFNSNNYHLDDCPYCKVKKKNKGKFLLGFLFIVLSIGFVNAIGTYLDVDSSMSNYQHLNNNSLIGESQKKSVDSALGINNGSTINNPFFNATEGILGDGAWYFNNSGSGITFGNDTTNINYNESFSISLWVKIPIGPINETADVVSKGTNSPYPFAIRASALTGKIQYLIYNTTLNPNTNTNVTMNDSIWHYIVAVRNKVENRLYIYRDGLLDNYIIDTLANATVFNPVVNPNVTIGKRTASSGADYEGWIDEFIIYNKSLNPTDIFNNYRIYTDIQGNTKGRTMKIISGMVNYQHLNRNYTLGESETLTLDSATAINNGTILGNPIFNNTGGIFNDGCYEFDGSGSGITFGNDTTNIDYNESFSISLWVKIGSSQTSIASDIVSSGIKDLIYPFALRITNSTGKIQFLNYYKTTGSLVQSIDNYKDNIWHYVVAVRDKESSKLNLYIDGELIGYDNDEIINSTITNGLNITIGKRTDSSGADFNGSIDEFIIYNYSLTTSEISNIYLLYTENTPITKQISPGDYSRNIKGLINFTATFLSDANLKNTTLYIWNITNSTINISTNILSGTLNYTGITVNLTNGTYHWNYYTCDIENSCYFAENNFTLETKNYLPASVGIQGDNIINITNAYYEIIINKTSDWGNSIKSIYNKQTNSYILNIQSTPISTYADTNFFDFKIENISSGLSIKNQGIRSTLNNYSVINYVDGARLLLCYTNNQVTVNLNITINDTNNKLKIDQQWLHEYNSDSRYQPFYIYFIRLFKDEDVGYNATNIYAIKPNDIEMVYNLTDVHTFYDSTYYGLYEVNKSNMFGFLIIDEENISGIKEIGHVYRPQGRYESFELGSGKPTAGDRIFFGNSTNLPFHYYMYIGNDTMDFINYAEEEIHNKYGNQREFNYEAGGYDNVGNNGTEGITILGFNKVYRWLYQLGFSALSSLNGLKTHYNNLIVNNTLLNETVNNVYNNITNEGQNMAIYFYTEVLDDNGEFINQYGNATTKIRRFGSRKQWDSNNPSMDISNDTVRNQILLYAYTFINHSLEYNSTNIIFEFDAISVAMYPDYNQLWNNRTGIYNRTSYINSPSTSNYSDDEAFVSNSRAVIYDLIPNITSYILSKGANYTLLFEGKPNSYELLKQGLAWNNVRKNSFKFDSKYYRDIYTIRSNEATYVDFPSSTNEDNLAWIRASEGAHYYEIWLNNYDDAQNNEIRRATAISKYMGELQKIRFDGYAFIGNFNSTYYDEIISVINWNVTKDVYVSCINCSNLINYNVAIVGKSYTNVTTMSGTDLLTGFEIEVPSKEPRIILITNKSFVYENTAFYLRLINVTLNKGTIIHSTGLNLTINITNTIYLDILQIENNSIYFNNYKRISTSNEKLTFNITKSNKYYLDTDLPYFNSSTNTKKVIISNINTKDSSIIFTVSDCDTLGTIYYTYPNGTQVSLINSFFERLYTCTDNVVSFNMGIDSGTTIITLLEGTGGGLNACTDSVNAFISYVSLLGLLGAIVFISLIVGYLLGIIDKDRFKQISIISTIVTLILIGVLIIIGVFIISTLCTVF